MRNKGTSWLLTTVWTAKCKANYLVIIRQKYIKKRVFLLNTRFLRWRLRIWNLFLGVGIGNPIFSDFFLIFSRKRQCMGEPWGIGGFRGGPNIKQIVKKIGEKIWKIGEIGKKSEKIGKIWFFFTENGLKCIRNPTKHI